MTQDSFTEEFGLGDALERYATQTLLPPKEDAVRAAAARLGNTAKAQRMWAAYDGWLFAPESERQWLCDTVADILNRKRVRR